ncbi:hypothetical protein MtrunA17_Chr7g0225971 [Medicago truncatula]|uniref:Uncharacterized protein n=1 Tax=Medicago truncatula TaxID=3880 RepID=A0A396GX19_MEDTR|nr:hypothetical protein MtrunA17_Chr7g0225971 [Medicago truncatula]
MAKPTFADSRNTCFLDINSHESYLHRIFSDLTFKTNLPGMRNKAHYDVVPTSQDILSNILLEHLF